MGRDAMIPDTKRRRMPEGWPVGCNPPETCFTCRHPDCRNTSNRLSKEEQDFNACGGNEHKENWKERKLAQHQMRLEMHLCLLCGQPLSEADGRYKTCAKCRAHKKALRHKKKPSGGEPDGIGGCNLQAERDYRRFRFSGRGQYLQTPL